MTSLADKVARVKERMKQAEPYREIWSNEFHVIDQQNAIIQKQREVLVMARERFDLFVSNYAHPEMSHVDYRVGVCRMSEDAITAIDNVMKGEGV